MLNHFASGIRKTLTQPHLCKRRVIADRPALRQPDPNHIQILHRRAHRSSTGQRCHREQHTSLEFHHEGNLLGLLSGNKLRVGTAQAIPITLGAHVLLQIGNAIAVAGRDTLHHPLVGLRFLGSIRCNVRRYVRSINRTAGVCALCVPTRRVRTITSLFAYATATSNLPILVQNSPICTNLYSSA